MPLASAAGQCEAASESVASAAGSCEIDRVPLASEVGQCGAASAAWRRPSSLLQSTRSFVQTLLRRQPRLYAMAERFYGRMTFKLRIPHEPDFALFAALQGTSGLFLDIGANSGQSARSLRIFNTSLDILSFEPNRLLEPELRFTRRLLGPKFRYRMQGLGSSNQRTMLYVPMIGPTPQTPWATADRQLLESSRSSIERELGRAFEIAEVPITICRGDDMRFRPMVIKIDVEGLELDVLQGLEATLARERAASDDRAQPRLGRRGRLARSPRLPTLGLRFSGEPAVASRRRRGSNQLHCLHRRVAVSLPTGIALVAAGQSGILGLMRPAACGQTPQIATGAGRNADLSD